MNIKIDIDHQNQGWDDERFYRAYHEVRDGDVLHPEFVERDIAVNGPSYNQVCVGIVAEYDASLICAARIMAARALNFRPSYAPPRACRFAATGDRVFPAHTPVFLAFLPDAVEFHLVLDRLAFEMSDEPFADEEEECGG